MIYVTGDTHRSDIGRFLPGRWPVGYGLTRDDYVVILGDCGIVWDGGAWDEYWQDWLEGRPWTTLFIDGNHENHDMLAAYPVEHWRSGEVHRIRPHVLHLMRGHVFDAPDGEGSVSLFTFGGARSTDIACRVEGQTWWTSELPSDGELDRGASSLEAREWAVDYVLTHDCPCDTRAALLGPAGSFGHAGAPDVLGSWLQWADERLRYGRWYFGHHHVDREVDPGHVCLYHDILRLGDGVAQRREAGPAERPYTAGEIGELYGLGPDEVAHAIRRCPAAVDAVTGERLVHPCDMHKVAHEARLIVMGRRT